MNVLVDCSKIHLSDGSTKESVADNMRKAFACLALVVLGVLAFSFVMNTAEASNISVGTYDVTGLAKDTFASLEDVRIIAQSSHTPITIRIFDPDDVEVYSATLDVYIFDEIVSGVTVKSGLYSVEASSPMSSTRKNFGIVFFNVVPEAPIGTMSIALVMISAFGFYGLVKRRKIVNL